MRAEDYGAIADVEPDLAAQIEFGEMCLGTAELCDKQGDPIMAAAYRYSAEKAAADIRAELDRRYGQLPEMAR